MDSLQKYTRDYIAVRGNLDRWRFRDTTKGFRYFNVCGTPEDMSTVEMLFVAVVMWQVWLFLALIIFAFAIILRNWSEAIQPLWLLLDICPAYCWWNTDKSKRALIYGFLISAVFLSSTYQGHVSSESLKLGKFPNLQQLLQLGYRAWLGPSTVEKSGFMEFELGKLKRGREILKAADNNVANIMFQRDIGNLWWEKFVHLAETISTNKVTVKA